MHEKTLISAGVMYGVSCEAGSAVKTKLDETGVTEKVNVAGEYVIATGEAAASTVIGAG